MNEAKCSARSIPQAALALWNDVDPARLAEYERWHTIEHVPERVWVPGFLTGTRYVSLNHSSAQPRFFTLYEMTSLTSVRTPQYRTLVEAPTPWSASMRPSLRGFLRKTCTLLVDDGVVLGAGLLVARVVLEPGAARPTREGLRSVAGVLSLGSGESVTRIQIGEVLPAGPQALLNQEDAPDGTEILFLVQCSDPGQLQVLRNRFVALMPGVCGAVTWSRTMEYRFASRVLHADVARAERPEPVNPH